MKIMLVCTSGGHFSTMNSLREFWLKHERVWVTDMKSDTMSALTAEEVRWLPYQPPRGIGRFIRNLPAVLRITFSEKPDLIVSTGASIAVSFSISARLAGIRFLFVESLSRPTDLSLSAKLAYPFCDELYVQWPGLSERYQKAVFKGRV